MLKPDFTVKLIKDSQELQRLSELLLEVPSFALDIETSDWWNRHRERIALIQIAYRVAGKMKVAVIDALADLDVNRLRPPFELSSVLKIIHNAAFDANRLKTHYDFNVAPVFDTMSAARRAGEKKYSLQRQAEIHLNLRLDKSAQTSDWSRRPLDVRQLHYAAIDPYATLLLLYENQVNRGLFGDLRLRPAAQSKQNWLPLDNSLVSRQGREITPKNEITQSKFNLTAETTTILGIIAELPSRYSPDGLAGSVGAERVGLAGWIIDKPIGVNAEPDEETVKLAITELGEKELIEITETRRLQATKRGADVWREWKVF